MVPKIEFEELNNKKHSIRVKLFDGSNYDTQNYIFRSDSLIIISSITPFYKGHKISIPAEKIKSIQKLEINHQNVVLIGVGTVIIVILLHEMGRSFGSVGDAVK